VVDTGQGEFLPVRDGQGSGPDVPDVRRGAHQPGGCERSPDTKSEACQRAKALIDRLHSEGHEGSWLQLPGGVSIRTLLMNPAADAWIASRRVWGQDLAKPGRFVCLRRLSPAFRKEVLDHAAIQIDAGLDELYYDYGLGGTADVRTLFQEIRALARQRGRHVGIFGNCKATSWSTRLRTLSRPRALRKPVSGTANG